MMNKKEREAELAFSLIKGEGETPEPSGKEMKYIAVLDITKKYAKKYVWQRFRVGDNFESGDKRFLLFGTRNLDKCRGHNFDEVHFNTDVYSEDTLLEDHPVLGPFVDNGAKFVPYNWSIQTSFPPSTEEMARFLAHTMKILGPELDDEIGEMTPYDELPGVEKKVLNKQAEMILRFLGQRHMDYYLLERMRNYYSVVAGYIEQMRVKGGVPEQELVSLLFSANNEMLSLLKYPYNG